MGARVTLVTLCVFPGIVLGSELHSWTWFFAASVAQATLLCLVAAWPQAKRNVTPKELADELERHLIGNEGPYDWDATTSEEIADARLNRLIPGLIEYDRLETAEKREQFREIIDALRRGEIPD
jgi:hypothetical protein